MSTASSIRTHARNLGSDALFTTRDVLHCGSRHSVDQALSIMVKRGELVRWAKGVFSLPRARQPATEEVARIKAHSRGDDMAVRAENPALTDSDPEQVGNLTVFATTGSTSSFAFGTLRIRYRHACKRKCWSY